MLSPMLETVTKPLLGSSATSAPGLIATFGVAFAVPLAGRGPIPRLLAAAGTVFSAALIFRILDAPLCGSWSVGTHFIWHLLNAVALGFALLSVVGRAVSWSKPVPSESLGYCCQPALESSAGKPGAGEHEARCAPRISLLQHKSSWYSPSIP